MTASQLATIAVEMLPHIEAEAKKPRVQAPGAPQGHKSVMPESAGQTGTSRDIAAKLVGGLA